MWPCESAAIDVDSPTSPLVLFDPFARPSPVQAAAKPTLPLGRQETKSRPSFPSFQGFTANRPQDIPRQNHLDSNIPEASTKLTSPSQLALELFNPSSAPNPPARQKKENKFLAIATKTLTKQV